jgi:hypothetical protein
MTLEVKVIAALVLAALLIGGGWWLFHSAYAAGQTAGKAETQALWDQDKVAIAKVTAIALAEQTKKTEDALDANQVIHDQYQIQLATVTAAAQSLAERLRHAAAHPAAGGGTVPSASSGQGSHSAGAASSLDAFDDDIAAALTECQSNDDRLDALIAEITPQVTLH